jgi:hypothetical protein
VQVDAGAYQQTGHGDQRSSGGEAHACDHLPWWRGARCSVDHHTEVSGKELEKASEEPHSRLSVSGSYFTLLDNTHSSFHMTDKDSCEWSG